MLSVVVPAFREGETMHDALSLLRSSLDRLGEPHEIIVVSDGNTDATAAEARRHGAPVRVIEHTVRGGKGHAVRTGVLESTGDLVAFIDADMELHPDGIAVLVGLIREGADAAIGSKRHADSRVHYPRMRRLQSRVFQALVRAMFHLDVSDTQTGLKVFRGDLLRAAMRDVTTDGFAFDLELLVELRARGARIVEGPVRLDYAYETTTGAGAALHMLVEMGGIWRRRHGLGHGGQRKAMTRPRPGA